MCVDDEQNKKDVFALCECAILRRAYIYGKIYN